MNPRDFCKSLFLLIIVVTVVFYVANSFFVAKTFVDIFCPSDINAVRFVVATLIFLMLLGIPCWISYRFLLKPLKEFPIVSPNVLEELKSDKSVTQERAAEIVARAMVESVKREQQKIKEDDSRWGELKKEEERLGEALRKPIGCARIILEMLKQRESRAKAVAREFASMAGLTVAISSSATGDGLGMFFWKARLVHDTIRIYGFRPDSWSVLRIYAYVVFAAFLATSIEELCELLDVSELLGGFGARVLQGCVGGAIVLKGGYLTRAYLTQGISVGSRKIGFEEFKKEKSDEFKQLGTSLMKSVTKIGFGFRQTTETITSEVGEGQSC